MEKIVPTYQIGVKGIIINPNKKVLVLLKKRELIWDIPGGRIEAGETPMKSLNRELKEEILNLNDYKVTKLLNISQIEKANLFLIYYRIETTLEVVELSDEHKTYKWISYEDIDNLENEYPIDPGIKETLKQSLIN